MTSRLGAHVEVFSAAQAFGTGTKLEIVRDEAGDKIRRTHPPVETDRFRGLLLPAEATSHILAKKILRMRTTHLERDHYDLICAAHNDPEALLAAARSHRRLVGRIVRVVQRQGRRLFEYDDHPIRDATAPGWKDVVRATWEAVELAARYPELAEVPFPKLPGAKRVRDRGGVERG